MMAPGSVTVALTADKKSRVTSATLQYQPIQDPTPLMRQRSASQAIAIVDVIFGVCRYAHRYAATLALGLEPTSMDVERLARTVRAESIREALLTLGVRWPQLLVVQPLPMEVVRAGVTLVNEVAADDQARGERAAETLSLLLEPWFSMASEPADSDDERAAIWLAEITREIDAIDRVDLPLPKELRESFPGYRFRAQASQCLADLQALRHDLATSRGALQGIADTPECQVAPGVAQVETSRGTLIHRAELGEHGQILDYQIDAPTTRRFRDLKTLDGAIRALEGLPEAQAARLAGNWLGALDPCGGANVDWSGAHA